ncbi:hypothetical protein Bca4012_058814 [Brassica carinata]
MLLHMDEATLVLVQLQYAKCLLLYSCDKAKRIEIVLCSVLYTNNKASLCGPEMLTQPQVNLTVNLSSSVVSI